MEKAKKIKIKEILSQRFSKNDKALFYFVKGLKNHSNSIVIKANKNFDKVQFDELNLLLRKELSDPSMELLGWIDTVGGLIPKKNIYKIPFFNTEEIKEYNPWRVCPTGEHWVRRHDRQKKALEDVDGHCRKNKSKKDILIGDEIDLITTNSLFLNSVPKLAPNELGFKGSGSKYDSLISGWTAYWNDLFKITPQLPPSYVKALIATESSFDPNGYNPLNSPNIGPARGLGQITEDTQRSLSGNKKELKDHFVILSDDTDVYDPNKNICANVRWLFRKRETARARLRREPTWEEVLMEYKGRLKSRTKKTEDIRQELRKYIRDAGGILL